MDPGYSHQLAQLLPMKVEPERYWLAVAVDPGPGQLAPPVQPELGAPAFKTKAGRPGGPVQAARAGPGPGRLLSAADQHRPLDFPVVSAAAAAAAATAAAALTPLTPTLPEVLQQTGAQSSEGREPSEPQRRIRGLGGPGAERSCRQFRQLQKDAATQHPDYTPRSCTYLGQTPRHSSAQQQNMRSALRKDKSIQCRQCPTRSRPLQQDAATQHPDYTPRSCTDLGQTPRHSSAQQQNTRAARRKDKSIQCRQCGQGFGYPSDLQRHERVHSNSRPFVCPHCGAGFKHKQVLERHIRTHTGEKPHRCAQCGRGFTQLNNLRLHERTHTGARLHVCSGCGQRFTLAGSLQAHYREVHHMQRPHACPDCGRRFSRIFLLNEHSLIHSGQKPFNCDSCGRSFRKKDALRKHVRIHLRELGPGPAAAQ